MRCARSPPRNATSAAPGASARSWRASPAPSSPIRASPLPWPFVAIPGSPPCSGPCARPARSCAGPMPACSRRRSAAATGSTSWVGSSPWPGSSWAAGSSPGGSRLPDLPSLARFRSWGELLEEADEVRDPELRFLVQIIGHYGRALPGLVADLRRRAVPHPAAAERVLATAHKAKGLEWPRVRLADDFPSLEELHAADGDGIPYLTPEERDQELHLLYVAATRARQQLEPNDTVRSCVALQAPVGPGCAA